MVADALVSLAVVTGGVIIIFTNWYWVDSGQAKNRHPKTKHSKLTE